MIVKIETIYSNGVTETSNHNKKCTTNKRCIVQRLNENPKQLKAYIGIEQGAETQLRNLSKMLRSQNFGIGQTKV